MPKYVNQHWITDNTGKQSPVNCEGEECVYCGKDVALEEKIKKTAKWGWIVIDREDGEVKLFTGPTLIAKSIKDLSELVDEKTKEPVYGDPLLYDFQIKRTEEPGGSYYKVTCLHKTVGKLSEEEQKLVDECTIDIKQELIGAKDSKNVGNYDNKDLETAPEEEIIIPDDVETDTDVDGKKKKDDLPF